MIDAIPLPVMIALILFITGGIIAAESFNRPTPEQ